MRYLLLLILLTGCTTGYTIIDEPTSHSEAGPPIEVFFCPRDNCSANLQNLINQAERSIHCTFFDLDLPEVIAALENKSFNIDTKLVIDHDNHKETNHLKFVKYDTKNQFTHNKFCIIDNEIVWTGSFNPTIRGDTKNNNNALKIHSKTLAKNYESEFQELWRGEFGLGSETKTKTLYYNNDKIINLFCPEDRCAKEIINLLDSANESIHFMTFSFTHDFIGNSLIKKAEQGIGVKGVFEKSQNSQYSEYTVLKNAGAQVQFDTNSANMHHKVFIIDQNITITGSMNPTNRGDTRNDENVLIIMSSKIAKEYLEEFKLVQQGKIYKTNQ